MYPWYGDIFLNRTTKIYCCLPHALSYQASLFFWQRLAFQPHLDRMVAIPCAVVLSCRSRAIVVRAKDESNCDMLKTTTMALLHLGMVVTCHYTMIVTVVEIIKININIISKHCWCMCQTSSSYSPSSSLSSPHVNTATTTTTIPSTVFLLQHYGLTYRGVVMAVLWFVLQGQVKYVIDHSDEHTIIGGRYRFTI
jgi:hypothetical protein